MKDITHKTTMKKTRNKDEKTGQKRRKRERNTDTGYLVLQTRKQQYRRR